MSSCRNAFGQFTACGSRRGSLRGFGASITIPPRPRKLPGAKGSLERRSWMLGRQMVMAERDGRDREVMQLADRLDAMEAEAEQRSPALLAKVQAAYMCGRWGSCS